MKKSAACLLVAVSLFACEEKPKGAPPAASSAPPPVVSAPATTSAAPVASAPEEPPHECPPNSTGAGSFAKPCDAKGAERMMDVKHTKTDDKGPSFAITSKSSKLVILYGKIAVYFYDKAKKQIELKDDTGKARPYHTCSGNFFGGPMNPKEKATLTFSCVPKKVVPDDAATIEAEITMVGFADASGKKVDFYWRNNDLAPDARPQGGVK